MKNNRREFLGKFGLTVVALPLLSQTIFGNKSDAEILEWVKHIKQLCSTIAERFPTMPEEHRELTLYVLMNLSEYNAQNIKDWEFVHRMYKGMDINQRERSNRPLLTEESWREYLDTLQ